MRLPSYRPRSPRPRVEHGIEACRECGRSHSGVCALREPAASPAPVERASANGLYTGPLTVRVLPPGLCMGDLNDPRPQRLRTRKQRQAGKRKWEWRES